MLEILQVWYGGAVEEGSSRLAQPSIQAVAEGRLS